MSRFFKSAAFPILIVVVLAFFAQRLINTGNTTKPPTYSDFLTQLSEGQVKSVDIKTKDNTLVVTLKDGKSFETGYTDGGADRLDAQLQAAQQQNKIDSWNVEGRKTNGWLSLLTYVLPFLIFIGFWIFLMNQVQGGGSKVMSFGKSRAKRMSVDSPKITFRDVAGVDEAVEELHEIKEFLENPKKFQALGARIPKGVLIVGAPGTGKTLLAKAVAGEAGVPFLSLSGSEFVEMFVGVGAARVRDLFAQAQERAPCIIFIDELDALGKTRGIAAFGGHEEREQTLNQLLVEMDGFDSTRGVILLAATNRPEILDPALLRPGRFDRHVALDRPDIRGRRQILDVHVKKVKLAADVDLDAVAAKTPGFAGADLANLVNEATLHAARADAQAVRAADFDEALDRIVAGLEKKNRVMNPREKRIAACHEAGHAVVAERRPGADKPVKVSIIPRGIAALGYTRQQPTEDRYLLQRGELLDRLDVLLGGRVAEELLCGDISTGAENDLQRATELAREMVTRYGMSEAVGLATYEAPANPFLPALSEEVPRRECSERVAQRIDAEISRLLDESRERVAGTLRAERPVLERLAGLLMEQEVVDRPMLDAVFSGSPARDKAVRTA